MGKIHAPDNIKIKCERPDMDALHADLARIKKTLFNSAKNISQITDELLSEAIEPVKNDLIDYTTKKPIQSIRIALIVGMAIGLFIRRK